MSKRIKKSILVFVCLCVVIAGAGFLFPQQLEQTMGEKIVSEKMLIPGGQSVGIQMDVKGALIVGVENQSGPEVGDMIVAVDDQEVNSAQEVAELVGDQGREVEITVVRDKKRLQYQVTPYLDKKTDTYKLGFWIKERIAGIGTLTFYDPETKAFASLGHGIYEPETGTLLETKDGYLLHTKVNQIKEGKIGNPGELGGVIYNFQSPLGTIDKNTEFGIYGTMIDDGFFHGIEPVVMGSAEEVKEGEAFFLTTVHGTKIKKYTIDITKVHKQYALSGKGLEFKVTDKELLDICGGIVQGMSGSPIIQNGKIVGAVTHVLVNDPTRGYGIFIENMVELS